MRVGENYCPGILHAVPAKDGMLMRLRVPGGLIRAAQLSMVGALSNTFGNGQIEITSRANLQLRAISPSNVPAVIEGLQSVDMLPSARHDRVRNIVTSPLAGLDPEESVDTRPLVRELDKGLIADDIFMNLHAKFSFGIHGGGRLFSHEQDDLTLQSFPLQSLQGTTLFQLLFGGRDTGYAVRFEQAARCLLEAARLCIALAKHHGIPVRAGKLAAAQGAPGSIIEGLAPFLVSSPGVAMAPVKTLPPLGVQQAVQPCQRNMIPSIPLGRLTAQQALRLSEAAVDCDGDLRLACWRGVVLGAVPLGRVASVTAQLESAGLHFDGRAGFHGIAACAGVTGCDASLADVRADAALLAQSLAGREPVPGWTIHLSGCEKQCAMRHGASAALIGVASGYLVRIGGQLAPESCSPDAAISLLLAAHANFTPKVETS